MENVLSSKNFINQDSLVHSISENKHQRKRQADKRERNNKNNSISKKRNKKRFQAKTPLARRSPVRKTPAPRPPNRRLPTKKPGSRPNPPKRTTKKQITPKKPSPGGPIKPKPSVKPKPKPSVKPKPQPPVNPPAKPQTAEPTTTTTTVKPDKHAALKTKTISDINALRRKHQASALNFNQSLAERAQKIADKSHRRLDDIDDDSVGLVFYPKRFEDKFDPLSFWTIGTQNIKYDNLDEHTVPLNFARLVWVSSKEIGCGISELDDNAGIITICLLSPKGGIPGRYPENIRRPIP
uniref:SCP domain-containing protein n=1 Tax=Strongyloides papillosus TaxID=174720 RepID=A0A0N5BVD4_STREA